MNNINLLEKLVSYNTIQDKCNKDIINFIEEYLLKLGFKTIIKKKYLIMGYGENIKLGFMGHTDTVEYVDGWKTNPFKLTEKNRLLYGLGSSDMKGGIAAFLIALSKINLNKLKNGIKVYITYDEEIGFSGVKEIIKSADTIPEYMIFGEPTNNIRCTACKGLFAIKLYTKGIKSHSSTPNKGRSANSLMLKFLTELEEFYNKIIKPDENNLYEVPYTTMNIGLLNGGSGINSVAKDCFSYIDFRVIKESHIKLLKDQLDKLSKKYYGKYEIDIEINPFDNDISFITEKEAAGFMTEASFIENTKKIILGVGPITAHEIDEHISIDSFNECINQYLEIINDVCN